MTSSTRGGVTRPAVDVTVPVRDRIALARRAVSAILDQDYAGDVTVTVVFDGTPPVSMEPELVRPSVGARRVRVVSNSRTPGLPGARNTGILDGGAPLVAFCDDDDSWLPGRLARQVDAMEAEPGCALSACGIRVRTVGADGAPDVVRERTLDRDRVSLPDLLRDRLTELHPSTFLIRRSWLTGPDGLVDEEVPGGYAEDYELLLRAARVHDLVFVQRVGVEVTWHAGSYFAQRWTSIDVALRWLLERYPEFETVPKGHARVAGQIAFAAAAHGDRRRALEWSRRALRSNRVEPRAYLAVAVLAGLPPDRVVHALNRRGRGI